LVASLSDIMLDLLNQVEVAPVGCTTQSNLSPRPM